MMLLLTIYIYIRSLLLPPFEEGKKKGKQEKKESVIECGDSNISKNSLKHFLFSLLALC